MKLIFFLTGLALLFSTCSKDNAVNDKPPGQKQDKIVFIKQLTFSTGVGHSPNSIVAAHDQFLVLNTHWSFGSPSHNFLTHTWFDENFTEVCNLLEQRYYNGYTTSACESNGNVFCYSADNFRSNLANINGCAFGKSIFSFIDTGANKYISFLKISQKGNLVFQVKDSLFCMDSTGGIKWKVLSTHLNLTALRDVCETASGDILLLGEKQSAPTGRDFCVTRFDQNGNALWQKNYGGQYYDEAQQFLYSNDDEIFLLGHSNSWTNNLMHDAFIIKINANGDSLQQKTYGEMHHEGIQCGKFYQDKILVSGYHDPDGTGKEQVFVTLLDRKLNVLQQAAAPFSGNQRPTSCALVNHTFAVCGDKFLVWFSLPE